MTQQHPELADEQAYIDHAYECLERSETSAWRLRDLTEADLGGTFQARFERNAFDEALVKRLADLDLGDAALVFGRIDRYAEGPRRAESFHIGRLAVADEHREPVVVDWRAPVAEPFYRATGREPMGLVRRRHFAARGPQLLGIEDELFGERRTSASATTRARRRRRDGAELRGYSHAARRARARPHRHASATSSPRSRPSRTRSSARRRPACSSCRAARAPARRSSPCTAPPTCCTPTGSRSRTRACS